MASYTLNILHCNTFPFTIMNPNSISNFFLYLLIPVIICSESFKNNGVSYPNSCGGIFEGEQFYIRSPNYPENYPSNLVCYYKINGPECSRYYQVNVLDNSLDCSKARLEIENQGYLCGPINKTQIYFIKNGTLDLKFISNSSSVGRGFNLRFIRKGCEAEVENTSDKISAVSMF